MITLGLAAIICIAGLVWYKSTPNPDSKPLALAMFWVGLLAALLQSAPAVALFHHS